VPQCAWQRVWVDWLPGDALIECQGGAHGTHGRLRSTCLAPVATHCAGRRRARYGGAVGSPRWARMQRAHNRVLRRLDRGATRGLRRSPTARSGATVCQPAQRIERVFLARSMTPLWVKCLNILKPDEPRVQDVWFVLIHTSKKAFYVGLGSFLKRRMNHFDLKVSLRFWNVLRADKLG
jgi:hypothetical protein